MTDGADGSLDTARALLGRLVDASARERLLISVAAFLASVVVGAVVVVGAGLVATCSDAALAVPGVGRFCYDPVEVYFHLFVSPFLSAFNLGLMLKETTLLLFTGLSVAVAFRAGLFNIGTQGQLVLGGLATGLVVVEAGPLVPGGLLGSLVLVPLGLFVGAAVGGLYAAIPGALKAYADANEVITTIMLNFVASNVAFFLVSSYFQAPDSQSVETASIPAAARLAPVLSLFADSSFSVLALVLAVLMVVVVAYVLRQTAYGFDLRTSGLQPEAAEFGGVDSRRMVVSSMILSGLLGGLAGAVWVLMVLGRWRTGVPPFGFDGITVAVLAGNSPVGVVPAAFLFGVMKAGSLSIDFALGVPKQLVGVLRGLVILFVAMPEFFRMVGRWLDLGDSSGRGAVATDGGEDGA